MSDDKPTKFTIGETWSSETAPYKELVTMLGKPMADAIMEDRNNPKTPTYAKVTAVDHKKKEVTLSFSEDE